MNTRFFSWRMCSFFHFLHSKAQLRLVDNMLFFYYRKDMVELFGIVLRSIVVYFFIIIALRVFGKREITQLSVFDLVFILLISNSVQNAMVGPNNSLLGGIVAASSLFIANAIIGYITFRSKKINQLLQGDAIMLIYQGKILKSHLKNALISKEELEETIREHGVAKVEDVNLAVLETDGNISVIANNFQHRTTKRRHAHKVVSKEI